MTNNRIELHTNTKMSGRYGLVEPRELIAEAIHLGMPGIAITDWNTVQGYPDAYSFVEYINKNNTCEQKFKIIYGLCIGIEDDISVKTSTIDQYAIEQIGSIKITILIKNQNGINELYGMLSKFALDFSAEKLSGISIPLSELMKKRDSFVIGLQFKDILRVRKCGVLEKWLEEKKAALDYVEIEPISNVLDEFDIWDKSIINLEEDIEMIYEDIVSIVTRNNIPLIATNNVSYIDPDNVEEYKTRVAIDSSYSAFNKWKPKKYLMTSSELIDEFLFLGETFAKQIVDNNSINVFNRIESIVPISDERNYPSIKNADSTLKTICEIKAKEKYGKFLPIEVEERCENEIELITQYDYSSIFLIAYNITNKLKEKGFHFGVRGTVGGSLIVHLLGMSEINPLPAHYICPKCHYVDFVENKYSRIGLDLGEKRCPGCGEKLAREGFNIPSISLKEYLSHREPVFDFNVSPLLGDSIFDYIRSIDGIGEVYKENISTEITSEIEMLCSVVIVPPGVNINDYSPLSKKNLEEKKPGLNDENLIPVVDFNTYNLRGKLLSFDFYKSKAIAALEALAEVTGIDFDKISLKDTKILSLFSSCDCLGLKEGNIAGITVGTIGIPEFGDLDMITQILPLNKPRCFADIIELPGFSNSIVGIDKNDNINFENAFNPEFVSFNEGIMLYLIKNGIDEDIAYEIMEYVRKGKAYAKGIKDEWIDLMQEHQIPDWYIELCKRTKYSFPKAHCILYAITSWRLMYYKLYYPKEFYKIWIDIFSEGIVEEYLKKGLEYSLNKYLEVKKKYDEGTISESEKNLLKEIPIALEILWREDIKREEKKYGLYNENDSAEDIVKKITDHMRKMGFVFKSVNLCGNSSYAILINNTSIGYRTRSKWNKTGVVFFCGSDGIDSYNLSQRLDIIPEKNEDKARPYAIFVPKEKIEEAIEVLSLNFDVCPQKCEDTEIIEGKENMTIEEKYNIHYFNNKRYYLYDLSQSLMTLQDVIPYSFEYNGKKIYSSSWNRMTVEILNILDEINPIPNEELFDLKYSWSDVTVFSPEKRTNFSKFKDIYVNTNHTASHSGMSIKFLLQTYGVDPKDCIFFVRKHPVAEKEEVRNYYRKQNIDAFKMSLQFQGRDEKTIDIIIKNFETINKYLSKNSSGFDDFFLFDDYNYFVSYKTKTLDYVKDRYYGTNNYKATKTGLNCLDDYYKHREFYLYLKNNSLPNDFENLLSEEIEFLFKYLKTNTISASKLYARMSMMHEKEMQEIGDLNNISDFYKLVEVLFSSEYYFQKPFISNDGDASLENDDIIMNYVFEQEKFTVKNINDYVNKMHLKKPNMVEFLEKCSDCYIQVDSDIMVSKDSFDIDLSDLDRIKKELMYFINSFGAINTEKYFNYNGFPQLEYPWNRFLLVGIIRTYLGEDFNVKTLGGTYKTVEFLVEKNSSKQ